MLLIYNFLIFIYFLSISKNVMGFILFLIKKTIMPYTSAHSPGDDIILYYITISTESLRSSITCSPPYSERASDWLN